MNENYKNNNLITNWKLKVSDAPTQTPVGYKVRTSRAKLDKKTNKWFYMNVDVIRDEPFNLGKGDKISVDGKFDIGMYINKSEVVIHTFTIWASRVEMEVKSAEDIHATYAGGTTNKFDAPQPDDIPW